MGTATQTAANSASATAANQKLTAAQRAAYFNKATRRMWQNYQTQSAADSTSVQFNLPKSRLLGGCIVKVQGILTATHASLTAYTPQEDAPYSYISNMAMQYNAAFSPFNISGKGLKDYNQTILSTPIITSTTAGRGNAVLPLVSSVGGTANAFKFFVWLPNMLNERDPVSLILLQSDETIVNVNVTLGTMNDIAPVVGGFTFATSNVTVTLMTDTYTVPAVAAAFPDISVLKLVQERTYPVVIGENVFVLSTGRTYRKIGMILYNTATPAVRAADSVVTSNIQLISNQADIPYNIAPDQLADINAKECGGAMPNGSWYFDFSDNGVPNYGSSRDYIDTSTLTEFWLKFTSSAAGTLRVWSECTVRLTNS